MLADLRRTSTIIVVAGLSAALTGCPEGRNAEPRAEASASSGASTGPATGQTGSPSSEPATLPDTALALAFTVLPADATAVTFADLSMVKRRLGHSGTTGESAPSERFAFWEQARTRAALLTGTRLYDDSSVMSLDYGWTADDVEWEADVVTPAGGAYILRLRKTLDWDLVGKSLARNGFAQPRGSLIWQTDDTRAPLDNVLFHDPLRLLIGGDGQAVERVQRVIEGTAPSLATALVAQLLDELGTVESAYLGPQEPACVPLERALGPDVNDDNLTAYFKRNDPSGLVAPAALLMGFVDGHHARAVLGFPDEAAAKADASHRERIVRNWPSLQTGLPFAEVATPDSTVQARTEIVHFDVHQLQALASMVLSDDAPWALCPATKPR